MAKNDHISGSMFGAKKSDVGSTQHHDMREYAYAQDDMPDGAFFAMAQEMHGWEIEDWGWFSEVEEYAQTLNKKHA